MRLWSKKTIIALICIVTILIFFGCNAIELAQKDKIAEDLAAKQTAATLTSQIKADETSKETQIAATSESTNKDVYTEDDIFSAIGELVSTQEQAIINADSDLMGQTINPIDVFLMAEATHLAADQKIAPASKYSRTVSDIKKEGAYYIGTVEQDFVYQGKELGSTEQRYFMFEDGAAYDMGTVLEKAMWGNVFVAFPEGEYELAESMSEVTSSFIDGVNAMWGENFTDPVSIKVYDDKDIFLYSIKLSLPDWAGGWYESGESIKTYLYDAAPGRYEYLIRHEATHMMLSAVTNDNASYWMQEGFATTLPALVAEGNLEINRGSVIKEAIEQGVLPTVREHMETNLETLSDLFEVRLYYAYSSAMTVYLLEKMDSTTLSELFYELKTHPYISLTMSEKTFDTQAITEKCFKQVTGKTIDEYYVGFENWVIAKVS